MKSNKFLISFVLLLCATTFIFSEDFSDLFNSKISQEELNSLKKGETLIRNIGNVKNLSLTQSNNQIISSIHENLNNRKPNYLAEIIKIVPKEKSDTLVDDVYNEIINIESYTKIPYYSKQHQRWFNLYDFAELNSIKKEGNYTEINLTVQMVPFGFINSNSYITKTNNSLKFENINTEKIIYEFKNIPCVKPEKMYTAIALFEYKDYYILYGIGAVNAPSIFFLQERIDTAFIGRIKDFCKYMFEQIKIK